MKGKVFKFVLLAALVLALLVPSFGAAAAPGDAPGLDRALEVKEQHAAALLQTPGVAAVGVGQNANGSPAIIIFTETRGVRGLPAFIDGVPAIATYSGPFVAEPKPDGTGKPPKNSVSYDPTARQSRPVPVGVSTGHPAITAGTIGARVTDGTRVFALSNNHVYADENLATIGDNVLQPGAYDGGTDPDDAIGTLYDFEPIDFSGNPNTIDAAIAQSSTSELGNATLPDGYGIPRSATVAAYVGQKVMKYGRTTGQTNGRVYATNVSVSVQYSEGVALFENQIIVTPGSFSAGGDSGSLIVVNDKRSPDHLKPVGLLFAGSTQYTIANPIDAVLARFGVTIDGQ